MRIAMLCQSYPPMISGAALVVQRLARGMVQRGHAVLVLCASDRQEPYDSLVAGVAVAHLRSHTNPFRFQQRYLLWPHDSATIRLDEFAPDILHLHEPFLLALTGLEYARRNHLPTALTIHALPSIASAYARQLPGARDLLESGSWAYARWLLSQVNRLVAPTRLSAEMVAGQSGIQAGVISNGVDLQVFHPGRLSKSRVKALTTRFGIPKDVPIILHAGRLDREKQVEQALEAAAWAMRRSNAHLIIAGDGRRRGALVRLSRQLGVHSRCHFTGFLNYPEEVADLYQLATVFVTACEVETQGLVLLEASACGLPIVAVQAAGIPEIVRHGGNGFLAPPGDTDRLGKYLLRLISDTQLAGQMGQAGQAMAANHNVEFSMDAYEALYRSMLRQEEPSLLISHSYPHTREANQPAK